MTTSRKLLILIGLLIISGVASAQNSDILWQKTLTKDTIPISSIAIAEGKYVAALKGEEIVILDYTTGDSIKTFPKPADMYGTDIILGKNGERLFLLTQGGYLRSWDISSGVVFKDIQMDGTRLMPQDGRFYFNKSFLLDYSLDGKYIAVLTAGSHDYARIDGMINVVYVYNTIDGSYAKTYSVLKQDDYPLMKNDINKGESILSRSVNLNFSPSGNYMLNNIFTGFHIRLGDGTNHYSTTYDGNFTSLSPELKSYHQTGFLPNYIISSGDDFLLSGNKLTNIPPVQFFRTLTKTGFVFLPDDNHMLAFKSGGGVAAISNIEKDTWEKIYQGDSLTENIIQTNASRSAFSTATNNRITLWKIPATLQTASLTADFIMSKDTIPIFDSITFTNSTYPMKRGTYFEWNFGDGSAISSETYPTHKFIQSGLFTVTLNVRDTLGRTSSISKKVVVSFPPPKAGFTTPKDTVYVGDMINFTNITTPLRSGTFFTWQFSDGNTSTTFNQQHQFFQTGSFTVKLTVQDTLGRKDSIVKIVIVINQIIPHGAAWTNHFHYKQINTLAFSSNGLSIISGSDDSYSRIWEASTGIQSYSRNFERPVYSVLFTKGNKTTVIGSYQITNNSPVYRKNSVANFDCSMELWKFIPDTTDRRINWTIQFVSDLGLYGNLKYRRLVNPFLTSSFSEDENWYIIGARATVTSMQDSTISPKNATYNLGNTLISNLSTGESRERLRNIKSDNTWEFYSVFSVAISPQVNYYIVSHSNKLTLRNLSTDSILRQIPTTATSMHFSPDKFHLLTNTGLWDIYDSVLIKTVDLPSVFEYHPDGIHVFALRADSTIGIYNLNSNSYEYLYPKQPTVFTALAVAPDGKHIATSDKYGYVTVWNVPDSLKVSVKVDFDATMLNRSTIKTTDTVIFANTTLPVNNTFDFFWTFGDGTTSSERTPKHSFTKAGTFTVTLTAFQNGKVVDGMTKKSYITVIGTNSAENPKAGLEPNFNVIPNPNYGEMTINYTLTQPSNIHIRITDVLGREVENLSLQEQSGEHSLRWNSTSGIGMYYCTFSVGGNVHTLPFVVMP